MNSTLALELVNGAIRNLDEYHLTPCTATVKLNQNENPYDWPQEIKDELAAFVKNRPWNRYPDFVPDGLKKAIAAYTGLSPDAVIAGNGSNEMLLLCILSLSKPGRPVITCQPTFTVYQLLIQGLERRVHAVFCNNDLSFDVDAMLTACAGNPGAPLIVCSPNNPTGAALTETQVRTLLEARQGFLILDQAYVEFGGFNAIPLLAAYPNLLITRTFSKAFRGAGIRVGYMLGNPAIISQINKIKLPYNINFFSEQVAKVLLSRHQELHEAVTAIIGQRRSLHAFCATLPFDNVYPSCANFILVRTAHKDGLFTFLRDRGILVRDVSSYPMLENCLRFSVGTENENLLLMNALAKYFNTVNPSSH